MQRKLNHELQQFTVRLHSPRTGVVRRTLERLEEIGQRYPAFVEWVVGEVWVSNRETIQSDNTLERAPHRPLILLWMVGWLAKTGHLRLRHLPQLDLRNMGVTEFPSILRYMKGLRRLRLEGNPIRECCPDIEEICIDQHQLHRYFWICKNMKTPPALSIDFSGYQKDDSIDWSSLEHIPNIVCVRIANSSVEEIPDWIRPMKDLKELDLVGCRIRNLPDWLSDLSSLEKIDLRQQCHEEEIQRTKSLKAMVLL